MWHKSVGLTKKVELIAIEFTKYGETLPIAKVLNRFKAFNWLSFHDLLTLAMVAYGTWSLQLLLIGAMPALLSALG